MNEPVLSSSGRDRTRFHFTLVEAFFWCGLSVSSFNVVYLNELKVSSTLIGVILSSYALISLFAQPVWAWMADRLGSSKKVLMACLGASSVCYLLLAFVRPVGLVVGIMMADVFFRCATGTLLDVWIVSKVSADSKIGYGSIRLWGSIGFAVMMFVYGRVVNAHTVRLIFPCYSVFMLVTIFFCSRIQGNNLPIRAGKGAGKMGDLFRNYSYVTFLAFVLILNIPNSPFMNFLPTLVKSVGGSNAQFGLMQSVKALCEVPFFLFGRRLLNRFGPVKLMLFSTFVSLAQALAYATAKGVVGVALSLLLSGPSFSLFSLGMLHYIYSLAPDGRKTTAQVLAGTVSGNISAMVGNAGGGALIDGYQLRSLYWVGAMFITAAMALFALRTVLKNRFEKKNEERCAP